MHRDTAGEVSNYRLGRPNEAPTPETKVGMSYRSDSGISLCEQGEEVIVCSVIGVGLFLGIRKVELDRDRSLDWWRG